MANWLEISLESDGEGAEAVADVLRRYAHQGVAIEHPLPQEIWPEETPQGGPLVIRAYIPVTEDIEETKQKIKEAIYYLGRLYPIPEPTFRTVKEEDWAEAWKQHYHPVRVGERILIKPAWVERIDTKPDDIVLELDPGMAFGTGTHPTTQLCLQACEWFARPGLSMIDLGTGSGILAIAAAKLGCNRIIGRDIDETAVRVAQENARRNGVADKITIQHGSLAGLVTSARHFDLGMANITAKIILQMADEGLQHIIYPYSRFVFSGIIEDQAETVIERLDQIGLKLLGQRQMGDWIMLITQRHQD